jgi:hypothetical protein
MRTYAEMVCTLAALEKKHSMLKAIAVLEHACEDIRSAC